MLGYEFILAIQGVPEHFNYLVTCLRLEQTRLKLWCEATCIDAEGNFAGNNLNSSRVLLSDILAQMQDAHDRFGELHSKSYQLLPESSAFIPQGLSLTTNVPDIADLKDRTSVSIASEGNFWAKIVQKIGGKHIGKRCKWVAFRAEEFKNLLQQLPSFNDKLHGLLDNQSQKEIVRVTNNTHMVARGALQINNKVDDLLNPVQALRAFETSQSECNLVSVLLTSQEKTS